MTLQRDVTVGVGLLATLALLVALGSVALLVRMGPAIEQILERNGRSLETGEDMLLNVVLMGEAPATPQARADFLASLERARQYVTEPEEEPVIATLERFAPAMLDGDATARMEVGRALRRLGEINRAAMHRADDDARRLGSAGAWACVFLGLTSLLASIGVSRRLRHRAVEPLSELHDAVEAFVRGDHHRRSRTLDANDELRRLAQNINRLLDEHATPQPRHARRAPDADERAVLLHLLDEVDHVKVLTDADGEILAANQSALAMLASEEGNRLRTALRSALDRSDDVPAVPSDDAPTVEAAQEQGGSPPRPRTGDPGAPPSPSIRVTRVPRVERWICELARAPSPPEGTRPTA